MIRLVFDQFYVETYLTITDLDEIPLNLFPQGLIIIVMKGGGKKGPHVENVLWNTKYLFVIIFKNH